MQGEKRESVLQAPFFIAALPCPTHLQLKEFVAWLVTKNLARASIRIIVSELSAVLNYAVEDAVIHSNPAVRLGKFYKQAGWGQMTERCYS